MTEPIGQRCRPAEDLPDNLAESGRIPQRSGLDLDLHFRTDEAGDDHGGGRPDVGEPASDHREHRIGIGGIGDDTSKNLALRVLHDSMSRRADSGEGNVWIFDIDGRLEVFRPRATISSTLGHFNVLLRPTSRNVKRITFREAANKSKC
ncbi:hypothetical protein KL86PLE_70161 [uncultured Pleomorphomonas sp.]|uniref:Uncharacterized protein n=1 Tax=uncultured Pleomorphomonas sp. TaxID=442121 RepID=A0A212LLL6_9HYPH|nr:hypothetical protein KL86PLE_70161 [uncultured Pleomorphomonas sp.]